MGKQVAESECLQALENFVVKMEKLPPVIDHPEIADAMRDFCELFHIAKVEAILHSSAAPQNDPNAPVDYAPEDDGVPHSAFDNMHAVYYNLGDEDPARIFSITKETPDKSTVDYHIYSIKDAPDWTDEDKSHLLVFLTMLFVFNGRARVMGIADYLRFHEQEFHMHNLNYFMQEATKAIAEIPPGELVACYFSINGISTINEQLGRKNGTDIMLRFVRGLEFLLGETGILCRLGGGNYITLFRKGVMQRIIDYLGGSVLETGQKGIKKVRMSANAGLYVISENCKGAHHMMDRVMFAYESTKNANSSYYAIYDERMKQISEEIKWVEAQFDPAIDNEEFLVYYQPKVNLKDNTLSGAEALCRWKHDGQLISPAHFIPVLEQSNLICILDFYMLEHVCQDIRRWLDQGLPVVRISVNISRIHLGNEDLAEQIFDIINDYNVPYEYIEIELTETTTDVDFSELKRVVRQLRKAGISTAVDDFGVGYSSLNLIRDLPWNVLKIDRSFLPSAEDRNDTQKETMLKHVISMAQDLGLECIVEGTETENQIELLKGDSCFKAQGFYFDKPLPPDEFEKRLRNPKYE